MAFLKGDFVLFNGPDNFRLGNVISLSDSDEEIENNFYRNTSPDFDLKFVSHPQKSEPSSYKFLTPGNAKENECIIVSDDSDITDVGNEFLSDSDSSLPEIKILKSPLKNYSNRPTASTIKLQIPPVESSPSVSLVDEYIWLSDSETDFPDFLPARKPKRKLKKYDFNSNGTEVFSVSGSSSYDSDSNEFLNLFSQENKRPACKAQFHIDPNLNVAETLPTDELYTTNAITLGTLQQLHGSLNSCPNENTFAENPKGLNSDVQLMPHQKRALAWLMWREQQNPCGGILADDMGLGKTLTMISLVLKSKEVAVDFKNTVRNDWCPADVKENGGTLVVCPATLLEQWENEIRSKCKSEALNTLIYHGSRREITSKLLSRYDVVITTYNLVRTEAGYVPSKKKDKNLSRDISIKKGPLHKIKWSRLILDEAHIIRNYKSQCCVTACRLQAFSRWVLTGTPIHNRSLDLYALLKFLRVSPFDDLRLWKKIVGRNHPAGLQRLNTLLKSLMLRRTKQELQAAGAMECLPEKTFHVIPITLDKEEFSLYEQVLIFSKKMFQEFLDQRAYKEQLKLMGNDVFLQQERQVVTNQFTSKINEMQEKIKDAPNIQTFIILVLLLRLRQLCCHSALIKSMIDKETHETNGIDEGSRTDFNLISYMNNMKLKEKANTASVNYDKSTNIWNASNPMFSSDRASSKMKSLFDLLETTVLAQGEKAVIVSQWTSMLDILYEHLKCKGISCDVLSGAVPIQDRISLVDKFNNADSEPQILLLSLTAGGVGLNLIGGNHLFLFDLHWNPQLEAQAYDRVYRVGQTKNVHIYKFLCEDTIEERIDLLQKQKLQLASNVLSGDHHIQVSRLSLNDIRMLFSM